MALLDSRGRLGKNTKIPCPDPIFGRILMVNIHCKTGRFKKQRRYREWKGAVDFLENLLRISGRACELEELEKKYDDWFKEYKLF